jgi:N4-(beta-N-acetylglucosaminyl)-L-asparaginase
MFVALSTWKHGFHPNNATLEHLRRGGCALDAVEIGAKYCEADLTCMSVGKGGIPDDEGFLSLDASIMDHEGNCGAVCFVQHYQHAISIARRVMERNRHVMLAGSGAELFAEREGFVRDDLITEKARALYDQWKQHPNKLKVRLRRATEGEHEYTFEEIDEAGKTHQIDRDSLNESHDTIGLIGLDDEGRLAGACTTSGLAFKQHGRVGDSPLIGSGLFVDGRVAAAVATGNGEFVMRACSTFHIVEQIRQGVEPETALENAIMRIEKDRHMDDDVQVGLLVIRADGVWSARSLRSGFQFSAGTSVQGNTLYDCTPYGFTVANG